MRLSWTRCLMPASAALALFAAVPAIGDAAVAPAASARTAPHADDQQTADTDAANPALRAAIDAEIESVIGAPAYAHLRAVENDDRLPPRIRRSVARLLEQGIERAAPAAHACRRLLNANAVSDQPELAAHCRAWLAAHGDGTLAQATCRRVVGAGARAGVRDSVATLIERCRALLAEHTEDGRTLRAICAGVAAAEAPTDVDDPLARRCGALETRLQGDDAAELAACVHIARFVEDHPELLERCRALLEDGAGADESTRPPGAEAGAVRQPDVGAETEELILKHGPARPGAVLRAARAPGTTADTWALTGTAPAAPPDTRVTS